MAIFLLPPPIHSEASSVVQVQPANKPMALTAAANQPREGTPRAVLLALVGTATLLVVALLGPHALMVGSAEGKTVTSEPNARRDVALVLGAGVRGDALSGALRGRMDEAISLYRRRLVDRILLSGDGVGPFYNETKAMERFAQRNEVLAEHVSRDDRGFSTHASIVRARFVHGVSSAYIVTQGYHLSRALWLAQTYGIDALGHSAGEAAADRAYYETREFPARIKDFYASLFLLEPQSVR